MITYFYGSKFKKVFLGIILLFLKTTLIFSQGLNHSWLLGYWPDGYLKGRMLFDASSNSYSTEMRKMQFWGTEGNISDANGNFLMSSNGVWIANANNDTMMNGAGLNPNSFTSAWSDGLLIPYGNLIIPYPGDSSKYVLIHQTGDSLNNVPSTELYYSIIDMQLDGGLGGLYSKNNVIFQDTIGWGISACKHANGRDWWVVAIKDTSDIIYKILFTPSGIQSITTQNLNVPYAWGNASQLTFSPDGTKFTYSYYDALINRDIFLFNFDRCNGMFSNPQIIDITDGHVGFGLAFSSSSRYLYATSSANIFQINTDTSNIQASLQIVAQNDTFHSPVPNGFVTDFFLMYLAADGKIYITSGNSVQHLHFINYPDSAGMACDVQQHAINLGIWSFRAVPNHPNYYLGCDTTSGCACLTTTLEEINNHYFKLSISPNPSNGSFKIIYLFPQNQKGRLEIYDVNGKRIYDMNLPPWSTMQNISLPSTIADGMYNCVLNSGNSRMNKKLVVIRN